MTTPPDAVEAVVERLLSAPKYRHIHPTTIADIVRHEAARSSGRVDLERRARQRLHRAVAHYLFTARSAALLRSLQQLPSTEPAPLKRWCRSALASHFSSAERLPDLDRFYPTVLELTGPVELVADVACAINPLTLPWLREVSQARYVGYDFNAAYVELGAAFLARTHPDCSVLHRDVLLGPETVGADLALLLKTYHSMEDRRPGAGLRLVEDLAVGHVVVSFPVRAMNGRPATFARRHVAQLEALAERRGWDFRSARLPTEELVAIGKGAGGGTGG
jgi:16S rRNA (guanine(1405)-N(7))-methyltransferase